MIRRERLLLLTAGSVQAGNEKMEVNRELIWRPTRVTGCDQPEGGVRVSCLP